MAGAMFTNVFFCLPFWRVPLVLSNLISGALYTIPNKCDFFNKCASNKRSFLRITRPLKVESQNQCTFNGGDGVLEQIETSRYARWSSFNDLYTLYNGKPVLVNK